MRDPDPVTLETLEWQRVLEALAVRSATPGGARAAWRLPWLSDLGAVERSLREIAEASALVEAGGGPELAGVPDAVEAQARLRIGAVLDDDELLGLGKALAVGSACRRAIRAKRSLAPTLAERVDGLPDLGVPAAEILAVYTPEGRIADHASPELRRARGEAATLRSRVVAILEQAMVQHAAILQDRYMTLRGGRYVLPVRADAHERVPGIVHGTSQSGATLFVEPQAVVTVANRLRLALAAVEREEARVRSDLTASLRDRVDEVDVLCDGLSQIDVRFAAAELARAFRLRAPHLVDVPRLHLVEARHPLLQLAGRTVVPNDIPVESGRALVLSGPNAGGKTVALKTASMCALMLRAGLPLPASERSEVGLFENVFTDVGDAQSLDLSLSTFSARMHVLARLLVEARPGDLVALDEVCAGTDPEEGAALATAAVEALVGKGIAVLVTTHYPALKELALSDERMTSASVGFDPESFEPTYRLHVGAPGPSSALHVAEHCGVPAAVVGRARARVPETRMALAEAARRMAAAEEAAERARQEAERRLREAEALHESALREIEAGREKGKREVEQKAREVLATVRRVRTAVLEAEGRVRRRRVKPNDVHAAKRQLERIAEDVAPGGPVAAALAPPSPEGRPAVEADLHVGTRVWVVRMSHEATVLAPPSKGRVRVAAGAVQLTVAVDGLLVLPAKDPPPARPVPIPFDPAGDAVSPAQTDANTLDVRGLRAEEAEAETERFLDRLLREGRTAGFVIHGHGTGALRKAVRRLLAHSEYVARHRPGAGGEGGDGVTVFWIR